MSINDELLEQKKYLWATATECISPLRAKQVSEANLRSEQGGIHFTPFFLFLPYAKKEKKKKKKI